MMKGENDVAHNAAAAECDNGECEKESIGATLLLLPLNKNWPRRESASLFPFPE